jgi:hypothetical protein
MKIILWILFLLLSSNAWCQEWMLDRTKESIINEYKEECQFITINDSSVEFKCGTSSYMHYYKFIDNKCKAMVIQCNEDIKNFFIAKYLEEGYNVEVIKKTQNAGNETWFIFKNKYYHIEILDAKNGDLYMITTSYLGYLK